MYHVRPHSEPDYAFVRIRITRRYQKENTERGIDADNHHQIVGVALPPSPARGPDDGQRIEAEYAKEADNDKRDAKIGHTTAADIVHLRPLLELTATACRSGSRSAAALSSSAARRYGGHARRTKARHHRVRVMKKRAAGNLGPQLPAAQQDKTVGRTETVPPTRAGRQPCTERYKNPPGAAGCLSESHRPQHWPMWNLSPWEDRRLIFSAIGVEGAVLRCPHWIGPLVARNHELMVNPPLLSFCHETVIYRLI